MKKPTMESSIMKKIQAIFKVLIILYVLVTLYWIFSSSNFSKPFQPVKFKASDSCIDLAAVVGRNPSVDFKEGFPYVLLSKGVDFANTDCMLSQYRALDSSRKDAGGGALDVFYSALTDSLMTIRNLQFRAYSPDTSLAVLEWVERCAELSRTDRRNEVLWSAVSDFWFNHLAGTLSEQQHAEKDLKFDFRFRYLSQRLSERGYNVNMRDSKVEKFKESLVAGKWSHLISATWNDSGFPLRTAYVLIALFLLAGVASVVSLAANQFRN